MNILFITPSYKPAYIYGGAMVVVYLLAESLVKSGHQVTVYTTTANSQEELDVETNKEILVAGVKVYYFKRYTKDHSHIAPGFWQKIFFNVTSFDVVHLHSWWSPAIVMAAAICSFKGVKPVLSPHGMFCDYVLNTKNSLKKRLLHSVAGKRLLKNTFLHVSTPMEWRESQAILNGSWSGTIIPNIVELTSVNPVEKRNNTKPFVIGFISRIDPKKGLDILIKALSKVNFDYILQIAGIGDPVYVQSLKDLAVRCGKTEKLEWVGWKDNTQKFEFYTEIDLFALTSHNENFAVVVIESLSTGTPVFSDYVGLSTYVQEKQLGWTTGLDDLSEVTRQLEQAYTQANKRKTIREIAPAIIAHDFDKNFLAHQYAEYYAKITIN